MLMTKYKLFVVTHVSECIKYDYATARSSVLALQQTHAHVFDAKVSFD